MAVVGPHQRIERVEFWLKTGQRGGGGGGVAHCILFGRSLSRLVHFIAHVHLVVSSLSRNNGQPVSIIRGIPAAAPINPPPLPFAFVVVVFFFVPCCCFFTTFCTSALHKEPHHTHAQPAKPHQRSLAQNAFVLNGPRALIPPPPPPPTCALVSAFVDIDFIVVARLFMPIN